jgi:hypothetical protein
MRWKPVLIVVVIATAQMSSWLIEGQTSPLNRFFVHHPYVRNMWAAVNLPANYLGVLIGGSVHQQSPVGTVIGITVQWAIVGYLLSLLRIGVISWRESRRRV